MLEAQKEGTLCDLHALKRNLIMRKDASEEAIGLAGERADLLKKLGECAPAQSASSSCRGLEGRGQPTILPQQTPAKLAETSQRQCDADQTCEVITAQAFNLCLICWSAACLWHGSRCSGQQCTQLLQHHPALWHRECQMTGQGTELVLGHQHLIELRPASRVGGFHECLHGPRITLQQPLPKGSQQVQAEFSVQDSSLEQGILELALQTWDNWWDHRLPRLFLSVCFGYRFARIFRAE
mmetsp:Transcript_19409/g.34591  ORF Transcript_19409/g.34591 Transcript_19409/m.34591 type:complete len:239 (+) Transcript_19409:862-1578(+)